ncbi:MULTISPECIES: FAD-dependent monooxygenase [Streptomyces]|uniref:p-hydroxybenzoate 3-monooxygenase n=2 Tax=Streptomyces TaxID=1883 RepID=A0ABT9L9V8_STRGD|nr:MULTISPECIES: FAD-dependent monooxygenase [Streptomyces]MDP9679567.1 p-hydroxybenzoate 3-monooxygenase [Streptomyces griseoviridis]GGT00178.1 4-hydroxybenzoate 3-monooxygenase [Streptomyces griseoviridis]GGU24364.1 4-hydroxybenzoate 3-monooxygenase [Streptomyces daghestanicus]GHI29837.1 4-hydroxybenzoate 3-monooxygenase [Streptomyces daghestanicus]
MSRRLTAQVGIVGAGPAGLVAACVLGRAGIDVLLLEKESRAEIEGRARAGLVEHRVVEYLTDRGLADGMLADGVRHGWCDMVCEGRRRRIDYAALSGGFAHRVYPQQALVRDLVARAEAAGSPPRFGHAVRAVTDVRDRPRLVADGLEAVCDYVLCCDGPASLAEDLAPGTARGFRYPYDWLTALVRVDRPVEGVVYAVHADGFAGLMPRTGHRARLYLQVPCEDRAEYWDAERVRAAFRTRTGAVADGLPAVGEILQSGVLRMRGMVRDRPRVGRVLLAGDAAHVLTPSGAKGLNLAVADAADAAHALVSLLRDGSPTALAGYVRRRVTEAWQVQEFSDRLLTLLHLPEGAGADPRFLLRLRRERMRHLGRPGPRAAAFAHWYAGSGRDADPRGPLTPGPGD